MQRTEDGYIIIACDFCGTDWDEVLPMIEGHHGSVICLNCLKKCLAELAPAPVAFDCSLCLRTLPAGEPNWRFAPQPPRANPLAVVCEECAHQAAGAFDKDPDVDWKWEKKKRNNTDSP